MKIPENCIECGLCCINHLDDMWIEVSVEDSQKLPKNTYRLSNYENLPHPYCMNQDARTGRCLQLDGPPNVWCPCKVYDSRPTICREVMPGSKHCIDSIRRYNQPMALIGGPFSDEE